MELADEDLEKGFEEMAAAYNQTVDVVKGVYEKSGDQMSHFKHALLEKKAIRLIMDKSTIKEVEPEKTENEPEKAKKKGKNK